MEMGSRSFTSSAAATAPTVEEDMDLRRGPWTVDEDLALMNYITAHGEGRWNSLARSAGLRRTGKSCRLRWLNYLRPDVRRGNITPEEQLLILELHSRWGNRWSKIAQQLPGRTDNEIKNYWRTRVQKHAKQLKCDVNSKQFKDVMRYIWMPRLIERIRAANPGSSAQDHFYQNVSPPVAAAAAAATTTTTTDTGSDLFGQVKLSPGNSSTAGSSADSLSQQFSSPPVSDCFGDWYNVVQGGDDQSGDGILTAQFDESWSESLPGLPDFDFGNWGENLWSVEDIWSQQQF